jgi:hypothetical protein
MRIGGVNMAIVMAVTMIVAVRMGVEMPLPVAMVVPETETGIGCDMADMAMRKRGGL